MTDAARTPAIAIHAPLGADGRALRQEAEACGLAARVFETVDAFCAELDGSGAERTLFLIVSQEGAGERVGAALQRVFQREPDWSRLPAIFLVADELRPPPACRMLADHRHASHLVSLERPVRRSVLRHLFTTLAETRRRQYETRDLLARLAEAERRQAFLLSELRHRLRNSLAVLQAMFTLASRRSKDFDSFVAAFSARLTNFADAHSALSRDEGGARAMRDLVRDHVAPYCANPNQLSLAGPPVLLHGNLSFDLALIVHELATNAAKYGALSAEEGSVCVAWHRDEESGGLHLVWTESGGPPVGPPERQGLGSTLINSFDSGGARSQIEFHPSGVIWRVRLPAGTHSPGPAPPDRPGL